MGEHIGDYQLLALLGRGASGVVYRARRAGLERDVALKLLPPDLDAEGRARVEREARVASRIDHPNVVRAIDLGSWQGQLYVVMDYVPGRTLREVVEARGRLPWPEATALVAEAAEAVAAAHDAGVIHRDLKPANLLVDERDGRIRVTDFGLARDLGDASLTRTGELLGTPYFMAPEQLQGEPIDERADVYALGVILYELVTGRRPHPAANLSELARALATTPPPRLRAAAPDVPADLEAACSRALARAPGERFPSARELAAALRALLGAGRDAAPAAPLPRGATAAGLVGALVVLGVLAAWPLAERRRAADLEAALEEGRRRLATAEAEAAAAAATVAAERARLEAMVSELESARGELAARVAERRRELEAAAERSLRRDGHLAAALDATIAELGEVPAAAPVVIRLLQDRARHVEAIERARAARAASDDEAPQLLSLELLSLLVLGRRGEARALATQLLAAAGPGDPARAIGRCALAREPRQVLELARAGAAAAPDAEDLHLVRARAAVDMAGQRWPPDAALAREALEAAEAALRLRPSCIGALEARMEAFSLLWAVRGADAEEPRQVQIDAYLARDLAPRPVYWLFAGRALLVGGEPEAALLELGRAGEGARATQDRSLEALARAWAVTAHLRLGEVEAAARAAEEAFALDPTAIGVTAAGLAEADPDLRARVLAALPDEALRSRLSGDAPR